MLNAAATEAPVAAGAGGITELRITWYDDGSEGAILHDLLDRFEADNPDIEVIIDTVPYSSGILETLPLQLEAGKGPDMARVTQLGGLSKYMLDLRPYLSAHVLDEFSLLAWMQTESRRQCHPRLYDAAYCNRTFHQPHAL